jgi:hypothetical protein
MYWGHLVKIDTALYPISTQRNLAVAPENISMPLNPDVYGSDRTGLNTANDDLMEVNAGGKIVVVKGSTLTQIPETRLETLLSGRWDKRLLQDSHGCILLDVNPTCFDAIVDHLTKMMISSKDSPPSPPSVDDEHKYILQQQIELFGLAPLEKFFGSSIIKCVSQMTLLRDWLKEDSQEGDYGLLY